MQRVAVLALTLALTAVAAVSQGHADDYPSRPIRLIIGFPPGSAADITARLVGDAMSRTLGQQVVVGGAAGRRLEHRRGIRRAFPGGRLHLVHRHVVERHQ